MSSRQPEISIHALLAESDTNHGQATKPHQISIHALLAESDLHGCYSLRHSASFLSTLSLRRATGGGYSHFIPSKDFYPRSPCGERLHRAVNIQRPAAFLSTLSLRRATIISIVLSIQPTRFLSTLSLRRATASVLVIRQQCRDFYPRSPCGERPKWLSNYGRIHNVFLSTLSLRRATVRVCEFVWGVSISIHALLAESDGCEQYYIRARGISIHALLAESD